MLVWAAGRKREFAIWCAMGATSVRIMRQLLAESIVLALSGGILGLALGFTGVSGLLEVGPVNLPRILEHRHFRWEHFEIFNFSVQRRLRYDAGVLRKEQKAISKPLLTLWSSDSVRYAGEPAVRSGSPTYLLDMFAALAPDHKYLELAVVNTTD